MDDISGIYARESKFLDRDVQLGIAQGRVLSVEFPIEAPEDAETDHELLDRIEAYLQGEQDSFEDVTVALTLPTEKAEVLEKVREIPYGENATVEQVTAMVPDRWIDNDEDLTAVREALAANPAPILIPGHRVRDGPSAMPADIEQKIRSVEGL